MFCDLVGSTDLSSQLDPEDLREVIRSYQQTAAAIIDSYEGHIAQYLGDGLLVYFGWPKAHERDAERAVYTGLELPAAIDRLNSQLNSSYNVQLALRIGIHTGPVVVGEIGSGDRLENLALGETPNIAARLENLASPNAMVISATTAQLVRQSFTLKELGPHPLKGVAKPMPLFAVVSRREPDQEDIPAALRTGSFEVLVGRDEEIGLLRRRWEQSKDGLGQVVWLSGEAGIGKSGLVEGLKRHVQHEHQTRLTLRCSPYHTNSVLHPLIDYVQHLLGWQSHDSLATKRAKLEQTIDRASLAREETVPLLANLLSLPLPEDSYPALNLSPQQQRQHTQELLVTWLFEPSKDQPVLAVWEDLHWADPSTLDTLALCLNQAPTASIMHVLTFRPEFEPPWPMRSHITPIVLSRLERQQVQTLIAQCAQGKSLPSEVINHIVTKTDGVPLFVEELTKMILESDLVREDIDHYQLTGQLQDLSIPDTLQGSLMARLDQLNTAKEVAQLGAILGRDFSYEMLQAISPQDTMTLQASLERLVDAELLYQRGRPPQARYLFKHALIQDVAYTSLLRSARQDLHLRVAQLLETQFPDIVDSQPEQLAHHYTEGNQPIQAVINWRRAGERAAQRSAHHEAIAHLNQGLSVLTQHDETKHQAEQELMLLVALGNSLYSVKGFADPEVERIYTHARTLCQQVGDTPQLFPVLRGLILFYVNRGQLYIAEELAAQLLDLANRQPDTGPQMLGHYSLGMTSFFRGDMKPATYHFMQVSATYQPEFHGHLRYTYGIDLDVAARSFNALSLWMLGNPDQALQQGQLAVTRAQALDHPFSLVTAHIWLAWLHQFRREATAARDQAVAGSTIASEHGFTLYAALGRVLQGWALMALDQPTTGMGMLMENMVAIVATGTEVGHAYCNVLIAEASRHNNLTTDGLTAATRALHLETNLTGNWCHAEAYRLHGELLLQQDPSHVQSATESLLKALELARSRQAISLELRSAISLSRLWQSQGQDTEAREVLTESYRHFTEGFDTPDLQEASTLLQQLAMP